MRHRRLHAATKWACTAASVLIVAAWMGSLWWGGGWVRYTSPRYDSILIGGGSLDVTWALNFSVVRNIPAPYTSCEFARLHPIARWRWFPKPAWGTPGATFYVSIPLWMPFFATTAPAAFLWRQSLRAARRRGHACPSCGYDHTGLADGAACPECGAASPSTHRPPTP